MRQSDPNFSAKPGFRTKHALAYWLLSRAAHRPPGNALNEADMTTGTDTDSAVVAFRDEGQWQVGLLPDRLIGDLDGLIAALRQQGGEGGSIGLVDVGHEFLVVLRCCGREVRMLLSDITAAVAWDLAAQVAERLNVPVPDEDELTEVLPAGDLSLLADLGMDEMALGAVLADLDAYADEMLATIAGRLGFAEAYERVVEPAAH